MAPRSEPDLRVLQALRLQPVAGFDDVARRAELTATAVVARLDALAERGLVRHRDGALPGWSLTPVGRKEGQRLLADEVDQTGAGPVLESVYARFAALNQRFLTLCTEWQLRSPAGAQPPVLNDHQDAAYDEAVLGRLVEVDREIQPLCAELAGALDRFTGYGSRLHAALVKVQAGQRAWFDRPLIDSYHSVWFELHEDLLASLGRQRSDERAS